MLTIQDINNALTFLNRVDIKGSESLPMTDLQIKLQGMRQQMADAQNAEPPAPPMPPAPPIDGGKEGGGKSKEH